MYFTTPYSHFIPFVFSSEEYLARFGFASEVFLARLFLTGGGPEVNGSNSVGPFHLNPTKTMELLQTENAITGDSILYFVCHLIDASTL